MADMTLAADIPLLPSGVASSNIYNVLPSYLMGFIKNDVSNMKIGVYCVITFATILTTVMRLLSELKSVYKLAQSIVNSDIKKKSLKMDQVANSVINQIGKSLAPADNDVTYSSEAEVKDKTTSTQTTDVDTHFSNGTHISEVVVKDKTTSTQTTDVDTHLGNGTHISEVVVKDKTTSTQTTDVDTHLSNMTHILWNLNNYVKNNRIDNRVRFFKWLRAVIKDIRQKERSGKSDIQEAINVGDKVIQLLSAQGKALSDMMEIGKVGCIAVCRNKQEQNTIVE